MRIATWNVNSLRARLDKVTWWLTRARPDVLLMQETKLADGDTPTDTFAAAGYTLAHHGEGRWNGVAIASRVGVDDVITNFGQPLAPAATAEVHDDEPLAEARMISAVCGGVRVVSLYAPNGRVVDSPFYRAKLAWYERLARWLREACTPTQPLVLGGDFNVAPADADVWDPAACHGGTHVSEPERPAFAKLCAWGLVDVYRANRLLATPAVASRVVWVEIDREARKGKPVPSDHTPLVLDLDERGLAFDAGWADAESRIASRRAR